MVKWLGILSTVMVFVAFIAIVIWAWSGAKKKDFDEAARLPLDDDKPLDSDSNENQL